MKKVLAIVMAMMLMLSAAAMAENVVKIGVFEPASGDSGAGGKQETLGMQYANLETPTVEIGGEEYKVELVYADNGSDQTKAPSAAAQLVSQGVAVALGSYGSGVSKAGSPTFAEAGVPVIGVTCTNPQVTIDNPHYFRICFTDPFQGPVLASYAYNTLGASTVYCLGELGNDYDQGLIKYFSDPFTALGGTPIQESFPTGTSDFTSYLTNAANYGADVLFCPVSIAYATQIMQQAASQGVAFTLLGGDTLDSNVVAEATKGTQVELTVSTFYQEGADPDFDAGFKAWLNEDAEALKNNGGNDVISAVSIMGYDAYYVALEALKAAGSIDPEDVMAALPSVVYDGVSGHIEFDENGDAMRDSAVIKKANTETGDWEFVTTQSVD
ncbi:MAG: ABC transporter substrate-binding protein [Clostridia bacterium]|nr:ABC transporter substrate-binding protein [Clostridia bacterium]